MPPFASRGRRPRVVTAFGASRTQAVLDLIGSKCIQLEAARLDKALVCPRQSRSIDQPDTIFSCRISQPAGTAPNPTSTKDAKTCAKRGLSRLPCQLKTWAGVDDERTDSGILHDLHGWIHACSRSNHSRGAPEAESSSAAYAGLDFFSSCLSEIEARSDNSFVRISRWLE